MKGKSKGEAHAFSRVSLTSLLTPPQTSRPWLHPRQKINYVEEAQSSLLQFRHILLATIAGTIFCYISLGLHQLIALFTDLRVVLDTLHGLSHSSFAASLQCVEASYVLSLWAKMFLIFSRTTSNAGLFRSSAFVLKMQPSFSKNWKVIQKNICRMCC